MTFKEGDIFYIVDVNTCNILTRAIIIKEFRQSNPRFYYITFPQFLGQELPSDVFEGLIQKNKIDINAVYFGLTSNQVGKRGWLFFNDKKKAEKALIDYCYPLKKKDFEERASDLRNKYAKLVDELGELERLIEQKTKEYNETNIR